MAHELGPQPHEGVWAATIAWLPDEQPPEVLSAALAHSSWFSAQRDRGAWISLYLPLGRCSLCHLFLVCEFWMLMILGGKHEALSALFTSISMCLLSIRTISF